MAGLEGSKNLQDKLIALQNGTASRAVLMSLGQEVVSLAKDKVPQKTRNLHRTIRVDEVSADDQSLRIVAGGTNKSVGYAQYVEFGTKPRLIVPKPGRIGRNGRPAALAWGGPRRLSGNLRSGGKPEFFARSVRHPGTRPRPYLIPAAEQAARAFALSPAIIKVWNEAS
jgi:HK97 gp10 family phage protein